MKTTPSFSPLIVEVTSRTDNGRLLVKLREPLTYRAESVEVTAHAGFVSDFASIPRAFWWIAPAFGRYAAAAVIHDFLYREGEGTRKAADDLFLEGMCASQVRPTLAYAMYWAVRLFGGSGWGKPI